MSIALAFTHRGVTGRDLLITSGPQGMFGDGLAYEISIPQGTPCWKLADGRWLLRNLGMAGNILLCSLAEHPGLVIEEMNVSEISKLTIESQYTRPY